MIREELNAIGGQEMEMPVVHPADLWRETGRYDAIGPEMARFKDRAGRDMVLAMTHEEVVADLLRDIVRSYRQLPFIVYHFQTKFRDEPRSRGGLIRVREFVMKDSYTCDIDEAGLDTAYWAHHGAYTRIFERLGLETVAVSSDVGMMGGSLAHEFMFLNPAGEDVLVLCESCGYASNRQVAPVIAPDPAAEELLAVEEVETPGTTTIDSLAAFLGVPTSRTAKATFFVTGAGQFVVAIVRGDHDVNETKLVNAIKAVGGLRPAQVEEITARGMEPGYGSPIGARDALVVVDALAARSPNLVAGANRPGFHLRNVNVPRDFTPDVVTDIANVREGDALPRLRRDRDPAQRHRGRQHLQARDQVHEGAGRRVPGRGRRAPPHRHGFLRHRTRAQRRLHRGGAPRRAGHRVARRGGPVPGAPRRARARTRTPRSP